MIPTRVILTCLSRMGPNVISLESFTVLDGSRGIIADETNSVTANSETIETLLVKKGSNAAVIKMEVGVSPSSVIPVNVLWTITGGSASPSSGTFGGLRPYALLNTAGSYDVKAGCDTNKNNTLDESEVTRTIRVMAVQFTNTAPGNICQNDNDNAGGAEENKGNGTPDKDESGFSYDDQDIIAFSFDLVNAPDYGTLTLSVTTDVLEVWTDAAKSSQPTALTWDLSGETPPSTLYLEGTAISTDANVTLTYSWAGQSVSQVRKMVVLGEGFDSQMVAGCDLYLIPYVDGKPHFGPVCKDQRVTFKVVDCRTEDEGSSDPPPVGCPTDCSSCSDTIVATITGLSGTFDDPITGPCECSNLVGATLTKTGTSCAWSGSQTLDCLHPMWQVIWYDLACNGDTWTLTVSHPMAGTLALWTAPNTTCQPPSTGWTKVAGTCSAGNLTLDLPPETCPTNCISIADTLTVEVSGLTGSTECESFNGTYTPMKFGPGCEWFVTGGEEVGFGVMIVTCEVDKWQIVVHPYTGSNAATWQAPNVGGCLPSTGWTKVSGSCDGGTVEVTAGGCGGGSGGPDPAHENNAVVTELIVNGGSNVSGTSTSTERTATASTPGENQLSAQATVEWNGEPHTKTAQLTVVEITGIEYSQDGGSTWNALPEDEPADGDFLGVCGRELVTHFQVKGVPDAEGAWHSLVTWELTTSIAGWLNADTGKSTAFAYDHLTPYLSESVRDVKVVPSACASFSRVPSFTFFTAYVQFLILLGFGSCFVVG